MKVWPQTFGTSQELKAVPSFIFPWAYAGLQHVAFPWSLPFDLWREEVNAWLGQLGLDRHKLLSAFQGDNHLYDFDTAIEFLDLSKVEADILTSHLFIPWELWGFAHPMRQSLH
jgi:hypothetical protein